MTSLIWWRDLPLTPRIRTFLMIAQPRSRTDKSTLLTSSRNQMMHDTVGQRWYHKNAINYKNLFTEPYAVHTEMYTAHTKLHSNNPNWCAINDEYCGTYAYNVCTVMYLYQLTRRGCSWRSWPDECLPFRLWYRSCRWRQSRWCRLTTSRSSCRHCSSCRPTPSLTSAPTKVNAQNQPAMCILSKNRKKQVEFM